MNDNTDNSPTLWDIELDAEGIPILKDIVYTDEDDDEEESQVAETSPQLVSALPGKLNLNLPDYDTLLNAIRKQLRNRLLTELSPILSEITTQVLRDVSNEIEWRLQQQSDSLLRQRVEQMVEDILDQELKRK